MRSHMTTTPCRYEWTSDAETTACEGVGGRYPPDYARCHLMIGSKIQREREREIDREEESANMERMI